MTPGRSTVYPEARARPPSRPPPLHNTIPLEPPIRTNRLPVHSFAACTTRPVAIILFASCLIVLFLSTANVQVAVADKPNVVVFLVDDLGYMDIGANNPESFYETPNIDALAKIGNAFYRWLCGQPGLLADAL